MNGDSAGLAIGMVMYERDLLIGAERHSTSLGVRRLNTGNTLNSLSYT